MVRVKGARQGIEGDTVSWQETQDLIEHGEIWGVILSVMGNYPRVLNREKMGTV